MSGSVEPPDLQGLFDTHIHELPVWASVAEQVESRLHDLTKALNIPARVESRAKETGSLLGKAVRKKRTDITTFRDLAGARVVVPFVQDVPRVVDAIRSDPLFDIHDIEEKSPDTASLEYRGVHIDLSLVDRELIPEPDRPLVTRPLYCEVQVKTFAQSLWAELSHLVTYKADPSPEVDRRVRRLLALCEIIDDEIEGAMNAARDEADLTSQVAEALERAYFGLTGRVYDRDSSIALLERLLPSIPSEEAEAYAAALDRFVTSYREELKVLLGDRPEARGIAMLTRPEVLLVLERLTSSPKSFRVFWNEHFRADELDRVQAAWGQPTPR